MTSPVSSTTTPVHRPLVLADLDDVCDLLAASDRAVLGFADFTPEEVAGDLRRDDLESYGWYDDAGALVGYGWVEPTPGSNQVELDVYVHPDHDGALGHAVLATLEDRGRSLVAEAGHGEPWLGAGAYHADTRTQKWLADAGYTVRTTFTRMRIDLGAAPVDSTTDVVVREVSDDAAMRTAHEIQEESFVGHYGHVRSTYEKWLQRLAEKGDGWHRVFLAELAGQPLGVMVTSRQFEPDENADYISTLGVLAAGRGRGVAKAMLRHCFAAAQQAGRTAVLLHVDVANVTGALRLYESVGMRVVLEIDAWAKGELSS